MSEAIDLEDGWRVTQARFTPAETETITRLPQPLLRLWRSRGYISQKEKGRWNRHTATEVAVAYLLHTLTKLGQTPSEATAIATEIAPDLLFFALAWGDGACDFIGPRRTVEAFRHSFDDGFDIARQVTKPSSEDRFVLSIGDKKVWRCSDLWKLVEQERLEFYNCLDLLVAGRSIVERAGRPLFSFTHEIADHEGPPFRRLSHGKVVAQR